MHEIDAMHVGMQHKILLFKTLLLVLCASLPLAAQRPRVVPPPDGGKDPVPAPPVAVPLPAVEDEPEVEEPDPNAELLIAALEAQNEVIAHRLKHRLLKDGSWRSEKIPSGAKGMELFSDFDHATETYVRNPDLWAQDLVEQLTGVVVYNTHAIESYGGVLITPRHLLFCAHAHPHAAGTWPVNPERPGAEHRFLTLDGRLIKSTQIHQAKSHGNSRQPDMASVDLCVALLDRDLESEGLHVVPVLPEFSASARQTAMDWAREAGEPFAFFGVSQGVGRRTQSVPPEPIGDYPREHARMVYIKDRGDMAQTGPERGPFADWDYRVWDGDSGTPAFLLLHGEPHLWMILTTAPGNGPAVGDHIDHVNALISLADENAIAEGRLEEPTGHRVRVGEW